MRLCDLWTVFIIVWFILKPQALNDLKSCLFDLGLPTPLSVSYCSHLGELLLLSRRAAAPLSASCCSSLGELLLLSRRAVAPLSVSCCPSIGELLPLYRRAVAPLSASCSYFLGELLHSSKTALFVIHLCYGVIVAEIFFGKLSYSFKMLMLYL